MYIIFADILFKDHDSATYVTRGILIDKVRLQHNFSEILAINYCDAS